MTFIGNFVTSITCPGSRSPLSPRTFPSCFVNNLREMISNANCVSREERLSRLIFILQYYWILNIAKYASHITYLSCYILRYGNCTYISLTNRIFLQLTKDIDLIAVLEF